ncbi:DUF6414 family protein [Dermacoccus barathri]|uniref:Uncharacterized protein n=1 Tax=Dermacoccus barathri TaxID=322601 RepID=A0ABN2B7A7_9MICO
MILREYLYVDGVAVRGLLAQIDSGITEKQSTKSSRTKLTGGGLKGFAEHAATSLEDTSYEKNFADALFPTLESALESEGLLEDVSALLTEAEPWEDSRLRTVLSPGKIIRVSAPGYLMDARFMANIMTGFAVTHRGLVHMGSIETDSTTPRPAGPKKGAVKSTKNAYKDLPHEEDSLESYIPKGKIKFSAEEEDPISGEFLRGVVQVLRGMYPPGLHMHLVPNHAGGAITIRLQEGRQYMDSSPDVLFSRYGVSEQEWTVVGTVGHHAAPTPDMGNPNFMTGDVIHREKFAQFASGLAVTLGNLGLTDLAQTPGFSMVPWAVYRTLGAPQDEDG